jgi:hypothetical protein
MLLLQLPPAPCMIVSRSGSPAWCCCRGRRRTSETANTTENASARSDRGRENLDGFIVQPQFTDRILERSTDDEVLEIREQGRAATNCGEEILACGRASLMRTCRSSSGAQKRRRSLIILLLLSSVLDCMILYWIGAPQWGLLYCRLLMSDMEIAPS